MNVWPEWWEWELSLTERVQERMLDRDFTEVELRELLQRATDLQSARQEGRWYVLAQEPRGQWKIVLEPETESKLLVVVTAYMV